MRLQLPVLHPPLFLHPFGLPVPQLLHPMILLQFGISDFYKMNFYADDLGAGFHVPCITLPPLSGGFSQQ